VTLLKSLFCQKGNDNRSRYLVINVASYVSFAIASILFSNVSFLLVFLLLISVALSALTTLRRLNDALLKEKWLFTPVISFLVVGLLIIITKLNLFYWLLLLSTILSFFLLTYTGNNNTPYTYGYNGPINIDNNNSKESYQQRRANRVEPTIIHNELLSTGAHQEIPAGASSTQKSENTIYNDKQDIGEKIRITALENKRVLSIVIIIVFLIAILGLVYSQGKQEFPSNKETTKEQKNTTRLHAVSLPDNFSIMLSTYNGVIISWNGDAKLVAAQVWDQTSAQGDSSCQNITFNNGDDLRTLSVKSEDTGKFYANFSPIDTKTILNNIAFRGKFTLCGYSFSLKGSQAVLGKHAIYSELIEY